MSSTEKVFTLIIQVDLQCHKCYKKIQKVLCKLQPTEYIRKIDYDDKKNTVTVSGPFDPEKLSRKLRCKACDAIKDIKIVKPEEKKPVVENKKPAEEKKKPAEEKKKPNEEEKKKPAEEKKKPAEEKKEEKPSNKDEQAKPTAAAAPPPWSSTTTVNLQFTNMCGICYPWPCSDPTTHWGVQQPPPPHQPQQWAPPPSEGMVPGAPAPGGHPPWGAGAAPPKRSPAPCGGPSYCGGCGSCHEANISGMHGWPPMRCAGPSACRGCNGCRIVHESKFSYEEYPPSACAVM